jgi:Spy/CpxP family protein refolding chaperone
MVASVLLTAAAWAQGPGGMGPGQGPGFGEHRPPFERALGPGGIHGRWWNNPETIERLKLTEEQRKTFDGILLAHREKLIDLRAAVEKAELELEPLMRDDQPNEAKILAQIDKVAQTRAELEKANARFLLAIRAKLTPEQWKLVQTVRGERPDRPQHGNWNHGGQGGPFNHPGGQFHKQAPGGADSNPLDGSAPVNAPPPGTGPGGEE